MRIVHIVPNEGKLMPPAFVPRTDAEVRAARAVGKKLNHLLDELEALTGVSLGADRVFAYLDTSSGDDLSAAIGRCAGWLDRGMREWRGSAGIRMLMDALFHVHVSVVSREHAFEELWCFIQRFPDPRAANRLLDQTLSRIDNHTRPFGYQVSRHTAVSIMANWRIPVETEWIDEIVRQTLIGQMANLLGRELQRALQMREFNCSDLKRIARGLDVAREKPEAERLELGRLLAGGLLDTEGCRQRGDNYSLAELLWPGGNRPADPAGATSTGSASGAPGLAF